MNNLNFGNDVGLDGIKHPLYPIHLQTQVKTMSFYQEPTYYEKAILSDLQGAWEVLREEVRDVLCEVSNEIQHGKA